MPPPPLISFDYSTTKKADDQTALETSSTVGFMTLDLSFLDVSLSPARSVSRPVNVYDILREGWRETRVDMTLQFFLDPTERHGLGSLVMDALLRLLDGAPDIG